MTCMEVTTHLQPLQGSAKQTNDGSSQSKANTTAKSELEKAQETIKHLTNRINNLAKGAGKQRTERQRSRSPLRRNRPQPKAKGANRGDQKRGGAIKMPKEMLDNNCSAVTESGDPVCFAYQLGGCSLAKPGERCPRGWHVCAVKGCGSKSHGMRGHA